jgi:hypothetical protein
MRLLKGKPCLWNHQDGGRGSHLSRSTPCDRLASIRTLSQQKFFPGFAVLWKINVGLDGDYRLSETIAFRFANAAGLAGELVSERIAVRIGATNSSHPRRMRRTASMNNLSDLDTV